MVRSRIWLVSALALASFTFGTASAQGNLKVGVISVARLVEQSPQFAAAI